MGKKNVEFNVGDKVRLTGAFLRSTGQLAGGEGQSVWTVKAIKSYPGESTFVVVDESRDNGDMSYFSAEELAADPLLAFRRINAANLQHANKPDYSNL